MTDLRERVSRLLEMRGLSQAEATRKGGFSNPAFINDIVRGHKEGVRGINLERLARAFDTTEAYLLGRTDEPDAPAPAPAANLVLANKVLGYAPLRGTVQAGVFREIEYFDDDLGEHVAAPRDPDFPLARQVAYQGAGESMNAAKPKPINDGDILICALWEDLNLELMTGMQVVVEQTRDGGHTVERSLKEAEVYPDRVEFCPRSTDPRFKPIVVKRDLTADDGRTVRVLALLRYVFDNRPIRWASADATLR